MDERYYYLIIAVLLILLELVYFKIADKCNIIDKPNLRSSHKTITLRGGGIIFVLGAWLYAAFFGFHYLWFLIGLTLIAGISFVDDIHSVPNKIRLVVQFVAMFMMFYDLGILNKESWWIVIVVMVVCVGIINAYNFMDGINGITGGYSLAVLVPLLYADYCDGFVDTSFIYVTILSVLVFCFFNFRRHARCFAGDVGAIGIAFIIIFLLGRLILLTGDIYYILFLGIYGIDSVLTLVHRIMLHENLGVAHRKHAYQIMSNELRIPQVLVSLIYMGMQLLVSFGLLFIPVAYKWLYFCIVLIILALAYLLFMKKYYHLHREYLERER